MLHISDTAIRNRTAVGVLSVLIVAVGVFSYLNLPREAFPDVKIPMLIISTVREGVSPADMESTVTMKIEKKLSGLSGVKEISSSSAEGLSLIKIEFQPEVKVDDALQRVRDKVSQARPDLPDDLTSDPVVTEISFSDFPIMMVNMSGPVSPVMLKSIADDLKDVIEVIPGVMSCNILGALEREIRIEIDPDRATAYNLTIPEILQLIPSENVNISAGGMETKGVKFNVRTPAEFKTPEEAIHVPLTTRGGKTIFLDDVAVVSDTFKDRESYSRVNGKESITLSIQKRVGGNIIEITDTVRKVLTEAQKQIPAGIEFDITHDLSTRIRRMVADLENHILSGLVLVLVVLFIFLGWRASIIVALAIPLSLMISFGILHWIGFTLNMIVLFSLIMVLGMLVDDAIVVVENVWRHMQMGYSKLDAAILGTREVAMPVLTSTATKIAAFFPMAFWPGMMGDFMKYLPITLVVTLSSSLFVAMIINPTLCAVFGGTHKKRHRESFLLRGYRSMMTLVMAHRFTAMSLTVLLLVALGIAYAKFGYGLIFFPDSDPEQAIVNIRCPQGTNIQETNRLAKLIEQRIKAVSESEKYKGDLDYAVASVGSSGGLDLFGGGVTGPHQATITLMFRDYEQRQAPSADMVADIRSALRDIAGGEIKVEKRKNGPPTGAPVEVQIIGKDFESLQKISKEAFAAISDVPGLVNLRSDFEATRPELAFVTDRTRAAMLGLNSNTIGNYLRTALFGSKVGTYRQFNDEYDITVRLPESRRTSIDDLFQRSVPNLTGSSVPLSSLGEFTYTGGMGTINRLNQKRLITLTGDNEGRQAEEVLKDVQERLSPLGRNRLIPSDISDWKAFCTLLEKNDSTPMGRIGAALTTQAKKMVARGKTTDLTDDEKTALLGEICRPGFLGLYVGALMKPDFTRPEDMRLQGLSEEALTLYLRNRSELSKAEVARLNRLVLEASCPLVAKSKKFDIPATYEIRYAGEKEEQEKAKKFLFFQAAPIALLLIFLVLVLEFNTLSVPLIIMSTVLLSMIGVLVGLLVAHLPFCVIMTGVGAISLTGVVVANGIVLLDFVRALQRRGLDPVQAAIQASVTRLRPVFLTAITAILGLLPMATGISFDFHHMSWATKSESSQWWASMAIAVIYGLTFATILTLVIVPALYVMVYRRLAKWGLGGLKKVETNVKDHEQVTA